MIGTRPEAIKLAPVAHALGAIGWPPTIILTGQHPDLVPRKFGLDGFRLVRLACRGREAPLVHVREAARAILPHLRGTTSLLVVQGDTSSALAGTLAARAAHVPVAHVEAGLRSHHPLHPWPEEGFRIAIDKRSRLLFAPTPLSAANLRRERVRGQVHVTGNTAMDALLLAPPAPAARAAGDPARLLVTCHRRENWDRGLADLAIALRQIAAGLAVEIDVVVHPNPVLATATRRLLADCEQVRLLPPCDHAEMLMRMRQSDLILSDSGGVQEEACALGIPLLVLRETSERPEAIVTGNMALIGTDPQRIAAAVRRLLQQPQALQRMKQPAFPFGEGDAARRIAAIIDRWLSARPALPDLTTAAA